MDADRIAYLERMIAEIITDMDDLHWCALEGDEVYHKRVRAIAHIILTSLMGECEN
jgi:hypothetical protein